MKKIRKHINNTFKDQEVEKETTRKKCVLLELSNLFQNGTGSNGRLSQNMRHPQSMAWAFK